jgi:glycosyltransferase involved in cell wall biosynthesis
MISIVIPAYNEEKRIQRTLRSYIQEFKQPFECIIVLNGCTDRTVDIVRPFEQKYPKIFKVIEVKEAIGKGGAIRKGFAESRGEYIGFVDADLATPVNDVSRLLNYLQTKKVDGVIASRLLAGSKVHERGIIRKWVSKIFSFLVRFIFDFEFRDTQCGAKFFTQRAVQLILPLLSAHDMTIDVDILLACKTTKMQVTEMPSEWYDRSSSALLGSPFGLIKNGAKMFFSLLTLQRKYEKKYE